MKKAILLLIQCLKQKYLVSQSLVEKISHEVFASTIQLMQMHQKLITDAPAAITGQAIITSFHKDKNPF